MGNECYNKSMKQIPLTGKRGIGKFTLVDDEDFEFLSQWKWHFNNAGYAIRSLKGGKEKILLHREILNTPKGMDTDRINGNKLDNRRENLRIATRSQNMRNISKLSTNKSGYRGVRSSGKNWQAEIWIKGKSKYLGTYLTKKEAALAYNEAAKNECYEFSKLNFAI